MNKSFTRHGLYALILLLVAAGCSKQLSVEEHLASANQYIADSKYESAVIELKNALQQDSQSAEARWLLGKIYFDSGDILSAEKELQQALTLGWAPNDIMPALAKSLLAQGKFAEIGELPKTGLLPPAEASLLATKALAAMAEGKNQRAKKLINDALEKAPEATEALMARARILASQGDIAGAEGTLDTLIALEADNGTAWGLMGEIRMGQGRLDEALAAYDKSIEFQQNNRTSRLKRALLNLQRGNSEQAQLDATELLRVAPQHPGANYLQGALHFQAANYNDAIIAFSIAEPAFKQYPLLLFYFSGAQLMDGNLDQAAVLADRFHQIAPQNVAGRKLLATIRLQQGKYAEVPDLLRPVLEASPEDVGALNLMSNALLRLGQTDEGINLLSQVAALQPDSPIAQVRLGAGLLMGGKSDDATQQLETALELDPEFQQADILLVMNHLQKQDYEAAIEAAQAYRRRHLTQTTPLNLLGRVYLEAGQQDEARASFEKALKFDAGDPSANHNLAQMAIASGDLAAARQYYVTILDQHADFLPALIQLAQLDQKEGDGPSLVRHLEQAIKAHPNAIEPRLFLGRYYLSEGRPDKVAPLFANLDEAQKQSPQSLHLMALAQLSQKEHQEAQYTLEQLKELSPDTAPIHHLMAMAAAGSGDTQRTEQELRRALELDEDYLPSRIALARLALTNGRLGELDQHIEKLETQAPKNPDVMILRAAAANGRGDTAAAVELAEQAFALAPGTPTVLVLASYKTAAGDPEGALQLQRDWLVTNPGDTAVSMAIANNLQISDKVDEAVVYYEQIVQLDPDNVVALNNLAWNIRLEDPTRALEYARHASEIAPKSAEVLDTLAVVEYVNKQYKQAQRSVERALRQSPGEPSMLYHSAMISAALGDPAAAIKMLEDLFDGGDEFPEIDQARALLAQLKKSPSVQSASRNP